MLWQEGRYFCGGKEKLIREMAGDDGAVSKMMRPNDVCTASFYGDVKKLKELLAVPPVEDEPPLEGEFDPLAPPDEEAEAAAADRAAARANNAATLKRLLSTPNRIVTRLSPVNVKHFGFYMAVEERDTKCAVRFKASQNSDIAAPPLHWAVLGREHDAAEFLISLGADVNQLNATLGISVYDICAANSLLETDKRIRVALEAHEAKAAAAKQKEDGRAAALQKRVEARAAAQEEIRRREEAERLEAERVTREEEAAAAREAAGEGGDAGEEGLPEE